MLIAGNWKMNTDLAAARSLAQRVAGVIGEAGNVQVAVCPPFISLAAVGEALGGSSVRLGAQQMHEAESGAYTGEISAAMLRSVGCDYVILGHSERRAYFGETDAGVNAKTKAALAAGLVPIVCVGETLEERKSGEVETVVGRQLRGALGSVELRGSNVVVAYEPVWAIGTGEVATPEQAQAVHAFIREELAALDGDASGTTILYGGSMKPGNADDLLAQKDVDGGLIGGASLKAESFAELVEIAQRYA